MPEFVNTFILTGQLDAFVQSGGTIKVLPMKRPRGARAKHTVVCTNKDGHVVILNDKNGDVKEYALSSLIEMLRRETDLQSVSVGTEFGKDFVVSSSDLDWKEVNR